MLETIQKKNIAEKESLENERNLTVSNMEQKFNKQIKDLQENHNKVYSELLNHAKDLEEELKIVRKENMENKDKKNTIQEFISKNPVPNPQDQFENLNINNNNYNDFQKDIEKMQ